MDREITLAVGGARFGGWKSLSVSATMRGASGAFSFTASERAPDEPRARAIRRGERCEVRIGDEVLLVGYVDVVRPTHSPTHHEISVSGRDASADLVDCSARHAPGEWRNAPLERILEDLARPFGVPVRADVATGARFGAFKLEPGETAWAAVDRAARARALLVMSDGRGGLQLTRVSSRVLGIELRKGVNLLAGDAEFSDRERFSDYRVLGQRRGSDGDGSPLEAAQVQASARDPEVRRYRPLDLVADEPGSRQELAEQAQFEAATRRGRGLSARVHVQGWEHPGGVWRPNVRLRLADSWLGIRGEVLVTDVDLQFDDGGRRTQLTLAPPESFALRAIPERSRTTPGVELWE